MNRGELCRTGHLSFVSHEDTYGGFKKIPVIPKGSLTFTVVRNPFDMLASYYHSSGSKDGMPGWRWCNRDHGFKSFEDFIKSYCDPDIKWHVPPLKEFLFFQIFKDDGKCGCDKIIRYEKLSEGLEHFSDIFKVNFKGLSYLNKSNRRPNKDFRGLYTDHMRELVEEKCSQELELFSYGFDGPKNNDVVINSSSIRWDA